MARVEAKSKYLCGECGKQVELVLEAGQAAAVQCKFCGGKILYKMRTTENLTFAAR